MGTGRWLAQEGITAEPAPLQSSVELAPVLGLADAIVDLGQSGRTLQAHHPAVVTVSAGPRRGWWRAGHLPERTGPPRAPGPRPGGAPRGAPEAGRGLPGYPARSVSPWTKPRHRFEKIIEKWMGRPNVPVAGWETFKGVSMRLDVRASRPSLPWQRQPASIAASRHPSPDRLTRNLRTLNPPELSCEPPFWAMGCHLQTIVGESMPCPVSGTPMGTAPAGTGRWRRHGHPGLGGLHRVAVILFHGITGSSDCNNMRRAAAQFHKCGHALVAVNHRGAGKGGVGRGIPTTAARPRTWRPP